MAQALACVAVNKQPLVAVRMFNESPLYRILPDVFAFEFRPMPADTQAKASATQEHSVEFPAHTMLNSSSSALASFKSAVSKPSVNQP